MFRLDVCQFLEFWMTVVLRIIVLYLKLLFKICNDLFQHVAMNYSHVGCYCVMFY